MYQQNLITKSLSLFLLLFPALKGTAQKTDGAGLLLRYLELKEALVSSDVPGASAKALALKNSAGQFDISSFSEDKRKALQSGLDIIEKESAAIAKKEARDRVAAEKAERKRLAACERRGIAAEECPRPQAPATVLTVGTSDSSTAG